MDPVEELHETDLLGTLRPGGIRQYLDDGSFRRVSYGTGQVVHFEGEICRKLELILSGRVVVERIDESGNLMSIAEFLRDDVLGGHLLFSRDPCYPMTVSATQPTAILEITKERLLRLLFDHHGFLLRYLERVSDHAALLGDRIRHYTNRTIRESVLNYLEHERRKQGSDRIRLGITKKALAQRIGVQRTSLSRELARMRDDGLLLFDASTVELLAPREPTSAEGPRPPGTDGTERGETL